MIKFNGLSYFDDRLYILHLCKGAIKVGQDGDVFTTIYHEKAPDEHIWCVVTYSNTARYPLHRIDSFYKKEDASRYIQQVEPETPLISLSGNSPQQPISYANFLLWKKENMFKEYDWQSLYSSDGTNARETIGQTKEQFKGIL
ncbi:MAG: hypothetical protein AAB947_00535 [Patescibacteria group bacterium]